MSERIMLSRLIVLIQIIVIPVYFFAFVWIYMPDVSIPALSDGASRFLVDGLAPIFFSLPWLYGTFIYRYKFADAYSKMGEAVGQLPLTFRIFYTFNLFLVLIYFVFPIFSPLLAIISVILVSSLASRLVSKDEEQPNKTVHYLILILLLPLIVLITIGFYNELPEIWEVLGDSWFDNLNTFFGAGLILADSIAIGSLLYLLYEGASQVDPTIKIPEIKISFIVVIIFTIASYLYWYTDVNVDPLHLVGLTLASFIFLVRWKKGLKKETTKTTMSIIGLLTMPLFIGAEFLRRYSDVARTSVIAFASIMYFIIFLIAWKKAQNIP